MTLVRRLCHILGADGKANDVIWAWQKSTNKNSCEPARETTHSPLNQNVVFFTGDVQDYKECMLAHQGNLRYAEWDLKSTARIMAARFPSCHVWVVKAARMELDTFNIYSNFVDQDIATGGPRHSPGQHSWRHLGSLLGNSVAAMRSADLGETAAGCCSFDASAPLTLVGFSKGCTVLNQLVYDFEEGSTEIPDVTSKVGAMYWLDGGHNGGSNTWVAKESVLRRFLDAGGKSIAIHADVTPYQTEDRQRPWVGQEYRQFAAMLQRLGANLTNKVHFGKEPRSIELHFAVLLHF